MATSPTDRVLIAAAKLRVTTDRKLGLETPEWVVELAQQTSTRDRYPEDGKKEAGLTER